MTEAEWEQAGVHTMRLYLRRRVTSRQLRLFVCACMRLTWPLLTHPASRRVVEQVERFADGQATRRDLAAARAAAPGRGETRVDNLLAKAAAACAAASAVDALLTVSLILVNAASTQELAPDHLAQADLFREIVGNPFQRITATAHLPATVTQLAQALYDGEQCAFALHDALLDAGQEALAAHFARRGDGHPKGCWAVDCILGKS